MVTILMMSAEMATSGCRKTKVFGKKNMMSQFLLMTSPTKVYHLIQIILRIWLCDQSLVTVAFL